MCRSISILPMCFLLQSDMNDPGLNDPLLFPYYIPHTDYHQDDIATIGFPYNNTRRTRINGLGEDGISFINTGRDRDLGGMVLALDTRNVTDATLDWLGGTVLQNERTYAIRLQYRTAPDQLFMDLTNNNQIVEYMTGNDNDVELFENIHLPAEALGKAYVQLLWKYYHVEGDSGPRAELRLDNILLMTSPVLRMHRKLKFRLTLMVIRFSFSFLNRSLVNCLFMMLPAV